jgi:hypothetical protein
VNQQNHLVQFLQARQRQCLLRRLLHQRLLRSVQKHLGLGVKQNGYGDDSQHLNEDGVHVCGYGVATQSEHGHVRHVHQKNRGKPAYGGVHCRQVGSGYGVHLAFGDHVEASAPNVLRHYNEVSKHANSVHPSDALHHAVRRYVGGGSAHRDASVRPHSDLPFRHQHGVLLHAHVGQNVLSYGYGGYVFLYVGHEKSLEPHGDGLYGQVQQCRFHRLHLWVDVALYHLRNQDFLQNQDFQQSLQNHDYQ